MSTAVVYAYLLAAMYRHIHRLQQRVNVHSTLIINGYPRIKPQMPECASIETNYPAHSISSNILDALENAQRRATKQINGMSDMYYPYRLRTRKLPTLAFRRIRGDMIEIYKRQHGKYDSNTSNIINL